MTKQDAFSVAGPALRELYKQLVAAIKPLGPLREETKTSVHLVRKSAFAGVHPRKERLNRTIKAAQPIRSPRIYRSEQVSKSRWHHEVKISSSQELDRELLSWLREAYDLCG